MNARAKGWVECMDSLRLAMRATVALVLFGCGAGAEPLSAVSSGDAGSSAGGVLDAGRAADSAVTAHADSGASAPATDAQPGEDSANAEGGVRPSSISTTPLDPNDPLVGGKPPPSPDAGCGKIDFLFVIDNSGSMQDEQQNLIRSFPGFIDTIRNAVGASDHHILVADTDASGSMTSQSSSCLGDACTCSPSPACCQSICASRPNGTCNGAPCNNPGKGLRCDGRLGAGRVKAFNEQRCIPDSPRFATSATPELVNKFACMANVGTAGDGNERPMQAIAEAIGGLAQPGQCNAGFLRDDAILVLTFITDEEEAAGKSPGNPNDWIAKVVAAKRGNQEAVVVLGVFGDSDRPGSTCAPGGLMGNIGADPGPRLRSFVEGFKYGVAGSVCASDYTPFFREAVKVIDSACAGFTQ